MAEKSLILLMVNHLKIINKKRKLSKKGWELRSTNPYLPENLYPGKSGVSVRATVRGG
jgi:hypothetical protein